MRLGFKVFMRSASVAALAVGMTGFANAQTVAPVSVPPPPGPVDPEEQLVGTGTPSTLPAATGGEDIIVTAMRREQRLQDVPISIELVSGKLLDDVNATDFRSIVNLVPNVQVQTTAGNHVIYIRGFGSPPSNFSFDQSVSLYIDGIYAGRNRQTMSPFFDVERIEVMRGPQGALFGKNTPAGAVAIISAGPTRSFEAAITGAYNFSRDGYDLTGHVSGPVATNLGVRLAGRVLHEQGYIRNLATGNKDPEDKLQFFRGTVRWDPTASIDVTGRLEYGNQDRTGGISVSSPLTTEQQPRLTRYLEDSALGQEGLTGQTLISSVTANIDVGDHILTSISGYSWFKSKSINGFDQIVPSGGIAVNSVYNSYPERFDQISQEIRLLSPAGQRLEYIVGAYYDRSTYDLTQFGGFNIAAFNYFGLLRTNFSQTATSKSVFGQVTYRPIDALRVIGSLRYTHTDKEGEFDGELVYGPFALRPVHTTATGKISEGILDPSLTLQYDVTPDVMVYASYGEGSKSGGFVSNTYGTTDDTFIFRPERSRNYELGLKSSFFNGAFLFNLAAYHLQFRDLQVSVYNPILQIYMTGNAASATAKGVEGQIVWRPTNNFNIQASGAYNDLVYDDYPGAACIAIQPITECNPADPASIAANNLAGYSPVLHSKWSGSVIANFWTPVGAGLRLDTTVAAGGRSRFYNADNQHPVFGFQRGFVKVDGRLQIAPLDRRWHVALVGKNLTNELTTGSSFQLPAPITSHPRAILYLEPPRSISIEAGIRF